MISTFAKRFATICCALILFVVMQLSAQEISLKPVTQAYVLRNVTVVSSPGNVTPGATLVIKDGLIHSLGTNINIPVDAIPVDTDSLFVYAGFIDGLGQAGIKQPKDDNGRPDVDDPGNPPNEIAGITPYKTVRENLDAAEKSVNDLRRSGFTMAHVVPSGGMLPGMGSIILLAGKGSNEMVYRDQVSLFSKLEGARRVYPSTVMGVMAKFRELYRNAELLKRNSGLYASNPSGMQRPIADQSLQAFQPVINNELPVMFEAADVKSIQRVFTLRDELGFRLMLAGVKQGWDLSEEIKSENIPVFISLDLPEWKEEKKDSAAEESDEKIALERRKSEMLASLYSLPSTWSSAGIRFGFSTLGAKPADIHKTLITMKEKGVSEDVLLSGLTTGPAALLGLSTVAGTIEPGKLANLVVTDGNYFDKDSEVKYVFVEGEMFPYESKPKPKGDKSAGTELAGTWNYSAQTPNGTGTGQIVLRKQGSSYTGEIRDGQTGYSFELNDVLVDGSNVSFQFNYNDGTNQLPLSVNLDVSGNTFSGMVDGGPIGTFPIEGNRVPEK